MLPIVFDWDWSVTRIIFMGLLYLVLAAIGLGLGLAFLQTVMDILAGKESPEPH